MSSFTSSSSSWRATQISITGIIFAVISFTALSINVKAHAYADTVESSKLIEIHTLENNCEGNICRNFHFDDVQKVAFFDLKAEVRISDDSTYDIGIPTSYDTLIFENSTFAHFPLHFFYSLWVKELDMRNCSIERITWENFLMADEMRILLLSSNRIQRVDELTFNFAARLQYLFLDANRIDTLVSESFKGLKELKMLDLQQNQLEMLPEGIFDYLPELQVINLSQNQLRTLSDSIFAKLAHLHTLSLQYNELTDIAERAFEQQQKSFFHLDLSHNQPLQTLVNNLSVKFLLATNCSLNRINIYGAVAHVDLRDNQILELYFSQPESLESLNLRNNSLQQIASLSCAHNLLELDLSNNPELKDLPDPWMLKSLERLDLSNIGMSVLALSSLDAMERLNFLNISANHISEINPRNFEYLKNLKNFYIHANDWNCFNLKMLMDLLIRPNKIYFKPDTFDPNFPGEYINGIACLYRTEDTSPDAPAAVLSQNYVVKSHAPNPDAMAEVKSLRKELQVIVQFYEDKFNVLYDLIDDLKERLDKFDQMNNSVWEHITITT